MARRILLVSGGIVALAVLVLVAVPRLLDLNGYRPRLETVASEAVGMPVRIGGRLGMSLFPNFHVTANDGRILDSAGVVVVSVARASFGIALLPLLHGQFQLHSLELRQPVLAIAIDSQGRSNVEKLTKAAGLLAALDGASVTLSDGSLNYADGRSSQALRATGVDLHVRRLKFTEVHSAEPWRHLSLLADLECREVRSKHTSVSGLKVRIEGKAGMFDAEPITMRAFGGQLGGTIHADVSGPVPVYQLRCDLKRFRIEEFLKSMSPNQAAEGAMDFSARLSMQGRTRRQLVESAAGDLSLRGKDLKLLSTDLDRALSRFESSQTFNLVDIGAVFFAGPVGLAVTRGYSFAGLFAGSGGTSSIQTLVSDWKVEHGVAHATDVAMATAKNRIALWGGLDFAGQRFVDVTMAVVNDKGCATVKQTLSGPFADPVVEKPRVLTSIAGPVLKLVRQTRKLFPAGPCELSYSGSVPPPG